MISYSFGKILAGNLIDILKDFSNRKVKNGKDKIYRRTATRN